MIAKLRGGGIPLRLLRHVDIGCVLLFEFLLVAHPRGDAAETLVVFGLLHAEGLDQYKHEFFNIIVEFV